MDNPFSLIPNSMMNKLAVTEILDCNEITRKYGLILSQAEAQVLVESRSKALNNFGRVEFAGGIINKLIREFCDSPYLDQSNFAAAINDLIEIFYYFKNETLDAIGDDDLISFMKHTFDNQCQGSLELLQSKQLEKLAHNIRYGVRDYANISEEFEDSADTEDEDE